MRSCACQIGECVLCGAESYSGLSSEQVCHMRDLLVRKRCAPRTVLFRQGEAGDLLFLLRRGLVKLTNSLPDGREQILGLRMSGQLLGFETLSEHRRPYTAETLTEAELCGIQPRNMLRVLEHNPESALRLIGEMNRELESARELIRDLGLKSASERVASFLLSLAQDLNPHDKLIALPLSRQEIAGLLGLTIETVSRAITRFARNGLIQVLRGRIRIVDLGGLQAQSGALVPRLLKARILGVLEN